MSRLDRAGRFVPIVLVLSLGLAAERAAAQCGPDNINGTSCCTPVVPTLPAFPPGNLPSTSICWNGCVAANQTNSVASWTAPVALNCTEYLSTLTITDTNTGLPIMSGPMVLDYTRTWQEVEPTGVVHQVWRFVAKTDLAVVPVGVAWACQAPACIQPVGPLQHAFYYGYVDYSNSCAPGAVFQNSLVLHHACDFFIHKPGLSSAPGVFHPNASYAIVGPHTATQLFLPTNMPAPQGPLFFEATRDFASFLPPLCFDEDPMAGGTITNLGGYCGTTFSPGPKQHWLRNINGKGLCVASTGLNSGFQSLQLNFPTVPWFHMMTASIGRWTNVNQWPGNEKVWVDEGVFIHNNACTGDWVNINYGATTKDGWQILHPVLLTTFTDLADNYNARLFGPFPSPIIGNVNLSTKVIYLMQP